MATILRADGTTETVEPQNNTDFSLEELQGFVGGCIGLCYGAEKPIMDGEFYSLRLVVNDDAYELDLPVNEKATRLYMTACHPGSSHWDIKGDVLVCKLDEVL